MRPRLRSAIAILAAAFLLLPGLIIGCAGDSSEYSPNPATPPDAHLRTGAAVYRNGPEVNNPTDPGANRAFDRGAIESDPTNGARGGGIPLPADSPPNP